MPNLIVGLAAAETITVCGEYNGKSFVIYTNLAESDSTGYICDNCDAMNSQLDLERSVRICATCDVIREGHVANCKITDDTKNVKCTIHEKFEDSLTSAYGKCTACPAGNLMFQVSFDEYRFNYGNYVHDQASSCDYCFYTFYLPSSDAEQCVRCPDSGQTDGDGHLGIRRCYVKTIPDDGADETGTYVYRRDIDKCYHD